MLYIFPLHLYFYAYAVAFIVSGQCISNGPIMGSTSPIMHRYPVGRLRWRFILIIARTINTSPMKSSAV